jgi:glycosyltransferase involved in cell wall biosynthesis
VLSGDMLRVLHLCYDDPQNPWVAGGGAVRLFEIYRRLAPRLDSLVVATGAFPGARDETIEGVPYRRLGRDSPYVWSRLSYARSATRLLLDGDYDVAVFDFSTYTPLRLPKEGPIGITVHHLSESTSTERWGRLIGPLVVAQERRVLRRGRVFSATSQATLHRLREVVGADPDIHLVSAGVADSLFELRREEEDFLLYFGRIDWFQKGIDILLEAFRILTVARPSLRLKVAGRGRDAGRLIDSARAMGLDRNVDVLGAVGDAERERLLAGAKVLLMPSRFEGFGMVAAEAMAAGVPVIASAAGSLPEVIGDRGGGVLVPPRNAAALAEAAERLLADRAARERLSRAARQSAERFRWSHVADQHLNFLHAIHDAAASRLNR